MSDIKIIYCEDNSSSEKEIANKLKSKIENCINKLKDTMKLNLNIVVQKTSNDKLNHITPLVCFLNKKNKFVYPYFKLLDNSEEHITDLLNNIYLKNIKLCNEKVNIKQYNCNTINNYNLEIKDKNDVKLDSKNKAISAAKIICNCVSMSFGDYNIDLEQTNNYIEFRYD